MLLRHCFFATERESQGKFTLAAIWLLRLSQAKTNTADESASSGLRKCGAKAKKRAWIFSKGELDETTGQRAGAHLT